MRSLIKVSGLIFALLLASTALAEPRMDAVQEKLPEPARKALEKIPEPDRKLLALRSYLRSAKSLEARWSWTEAEIAAYQKSDQYVTAMAAVAAVVKAFEVKNPGYTLHVNTEVRSLEEQLAKWNSNASVKSASAGMDAAATKWLADNSKAGADELRAFIVEWKPAGTSMLAAPGLTNHGRGEAFDFQVAQGQAVVAGAGGAAEWNATGWNAKLQEAVRLSTMPFEGPLTDPNEPWHYDYDPPERAKLVVAEAAPPTQPETAKPEEAQPSPTDQAAAVPTAPPVPEIITNEEPVVPPVVGAVPVPTPRPDDAPKAEAPKEDVKAAKVEPAKAEPVKRKATAKKKAKAPKKRIKRKARPAKKRWRLPF